MQTIYDFITQQETAYQKPVSLEDGWNWSMKDHLRRSFLYKNFQFEEENGNRDLRPNKNIILGIRNLENRTEGFDVKDIDLFVDDEDDYYQSLLVKKYHEKWALDNQIDTLIDEIVDSYGDYGGVLVRNTGEARPEVIDLRTICFCNQKNILAYPFGIKHTLSTTELRKMDQWWLPDNGATCTIDELIILSKDKDGNDPTEIDIYEVNGDLPIGWLKENDDQNKKSEQQIQIVAFYKKQDGKEQGVTLFKKRQPKLLFKFLARDEIKGRALGRGGIEELFEAQKWTNWGEIKVTEMLESASKMIGVTDDPTLSAKHPTGLKDVDNMEFIELQQGKQMTILNNYPRNLTLFNDSLERWERHAGILGSAGEQSLSSETPSGMPFKLYEAKNIEDKSMHYFRRGKIAVFLDEIYRDWVLPHIAKEIAKDQKFLSELSADEMQGVVKNMAIKQWNRYVVGRILNGQKIEENKDVFIQKMMEDGLVSGNKKFIKILKNEITKNLSVRTNIAGKQKNLALLTDKLVSVVRQYLSTPQLRQDPEMTKLLNTILESSGLSPIMFGSSPAPMQIQSQPQARGGTEALKSISEANKETINV